MGVRKFFPNLVTKYKDVKFVFSKKDTHSNCSSKVGEKIPNSNNDVNNIDELYLDTNCLIHPVCFKIYGENKSLLKTNPNRLEQLMILGVINYIETLINICSPKELVYIAIDGVAPMAKIKQQRIRRFKSIYDNDLRKRVSGRYKVDYVKPWNNSAITPGTEFMTKITNGIINYLKAKQKNNTNNVRYVFNTAFTPGEGEHKILQQIRKNRFIDKIRVIYGLDADLLYLSMASEASRMFLIRELTEFQNMKSDDGFCYVNVTLMKECIYNDMIENLFMSSIAEQTEFENLENYQLNFIQDYVFFGFMIGNDFLSSLPSVHLEYNNQHSGLNILIEAYKDVFGTINDGKTDDYTFMIKKVGIRYHISYEFIKELFHNLACQEESFFQSTYKFKRYYKSDKLPYTTYEEEMLARENMQFNVPNIFQLGGKGTEHSESKKKFYEYYEISDVDKVIEDYFQGLLWNSYYYFDDCTDYSWYYKHRKTPFATDIYYWLINNEENFENIMLQYPKFSNSYCITPLEQLLMVLPVQSAFLLPKDAKRQMLMRPDYFPTTIDIDLQCISKLWQASPLIKMLPVEMTKDIIRNINKTNKEKERNIFRKPFEIII